IALAFAHCKLDERILIVEPLVERVDQWMRRGRHACDADLADRRARRSAYIVGELLGAGQPRPDLGGYAVAQLGQYNAATGTLEQSPSAFTLKFDDLPADM